MTGGGAIGIGGAIELFAIGLATGTPATLLFVGTAGSGGLILATGVGAACGGLELLGWKPGG